MANFEENDGSCPGIQTQNKKFNNEDDTGLYNNNTFFRFVDLKEYTGRTSASELANLDRLVEALRVLEYFRIVSQGEEVDDTTNIDVDSNALTPMITRHTIKTAVEEVDKYLSSSELDLTSQMLSLDEYLRVNTNNRRALPFAVFCDSTFIESKPQQSFSTTKTANAMSDQIVLSISCPTALSVHTAGILTEYVRGSIPDLYHTGCINTLKIPLTKKNFKGSLKSFFSINPDSTRHTDSVVPLREQARRRVHALPKQQQQR